MISETPPSPGLSSDAVDFYLRTALTSSLTSPHPVSLFALPPQPTPSLTPLSASEPKTLFLYPGSFNPPHIGHLATILYFSQHRSVFHLTNLFIFADPPTTVSGRDKKHNTIILPQGKRYELLASHPALKTLVESGWLKILVGDMEGHIAVLRSTTDLIARGGYDVKLVGFLGGDKLSKDTMPHERPGELGEWGPVDEFLIMNARRPVDFYTPTPSQTSIFPRTLSDQDQPPPINLPGCTPWIRNPVNPEVEGVIGKLWSCQALTVPGGPIISFRASKMSMSNGVSSTKIRRVMREVENEKLMGELGRLVVSPEGLVGWLVGEREKEREIKGGKGDGKGDGKFEVVEVVGEDEKEGEKAFL